MRAAPVLVFGCCALVAAVVQGCRDQSAGSGAAGLSQEAYVWQRSWNAPVVAALAERGTNFPRVILLAAEVTWQSGQPKVIRVPITWEALPRSGPGIGLALRIGPFSGPFDVEDARAKGLAALASSLVAEATSHQVPICELQVDFDCAESKLEGYAAWVTAIRREVSPVRVVITALPAWLGRPAFQPLAREAGEYVLQVHSLARPTRRDAAFTLCDPDLARQAVARAGRLGVPFRVALPTYGYLVAFDAKGNFAGLSAEGPMGNWQPGMQLREVRSDPAAMAGLVRGWAREHPEQMRGIIWYRLPVEGDVLNWAWPTLSKVMTGEAPRPSIRAEVRRSRQGLVEFILVNEGAADFTGNPQVEARWSGAQPVASDGVRGFTPCVVATNVLCFRNSQQRVRIRPQERQMIGWLRLAADEPVDVEVRPATNE
jgi:hypothetical protein